MRVCTFFGHRDTTEEIIPRLREVVEELIVEHGVDMFYMGSEGSFDAYAKKVVSELVKKYAHVRYYTVLAHMPSESRRDEYTDFSDTMLPEGMENVHPRYAIAWRNKWMVERAEYVVVYIDHPFGGAARFAEMAIKKKKTVINIAL